MVSINDLADGDILAFRGHGFWSRVIRLWTESRVTHVGMFCRLFASDGRLVSASVVESKEGRGVRQVALQDYLRQWDRVDVYRPRVVPADAKLWLFEQGEQGYASVWQFIWSWGKLSRAVRRWCGAKADIDDGRMHCSEFASYFLQKCGYELPYEPPGMSPGDVIDLALIPLGRLK